jgi:tetratricopeptide (TPR) repeat protein
MIHQASAVNVKTPQEEDTSLMQLIEQVMSLRTPTITDSNDTMLSASAGAESMNPAAPVQQATEHKTTETIVTRKHSDADAAAENSNPNAVEILHTAADKQSILHPTEVADVLYQAGRPDEAGRYYEMALNAVEKDNAPLHQWLLFQTANCLRRTDRSRAAMLYEELIRLYPNSTWSAAAQARHKLLVWMETRREELQSRVAKRDNDV